MSSIESMIGKMIGRYQIVELLGRGGMAEVFKAYQPSLERFVALKLMHAFLAEDPDFLARFNREAKNVAALKHPNIIQIHDFDHEGNAAYMVMEFVDGGTLKDRLEKLGRERTLMPLEDALRIIGDVGAALSFSHKRGMIHRDIKPANVMLDSTGRAILTDFGISKIVSGAKFTASGSILGTPAYMAPEQGLGQPGDHRSDIYSLGVMLYQLVTGRLPYEADTPVAVILKHVNESLPLPTAVNPTIPRPIENIIIKALAKDPNERYQSVDELLNHINNLEEAEHITLPGDSSVGKVPGGHTQLGLAPGDRTVVAKTGAIVGLPTKVIAEPAKPRRNMTPAIVGAIAFVAIITFVGVLAVGGIVALNRQTPTAVADITGTAPAPTDTEAVHLAETSTGVPPEALTLQALQDQLATLNATPPTATFTPTPDLTQTAQACVLDAVVEKQEPKDGGPIAINRETKIVLSLKNNGQCEWDDKTTFNFVQGDAIQTAASGTVAVPAAQPGDTVQVTVTLKPTKVQTYAGTWQITLGDGRTVGQPIVLTYKAIVPATAAPTVPPPTPTSAVPPSPTPGKGGLITGANPTFWSCKYVPNTTDYECLTSIAVGGGVEPFTITVDGDSNTTKAGITAQNPYFFQLRGRRCITRLFSYQVVDAIGQVFVGNGAFDPMAFKLFNNNSEVCGLGG